MAKDLKQLFEKFLEKNSFFLNKEALQAKYTPEDIMHRDEQIDYIAHILAPALRLEKPSNLFVYGKTGTGKTLSVRFTTNQMLEMTKAKNIPLEVFYVNCKLKKVVDTEYRLIAELARFFGKDIPTTGLPTDEVYNIFFKVLDAEKRLVILILDEIDQLVKKVGDEIIYNLTRINGELKNAQLSLIGISNDLIFADNLDPRVKSSLSEEELVFPPYNALQIQDILRNRSEIAFKKDIIEPGVIEKCSAYAAREHGDARRALELLRVAGEISERKDIEKITLESLDLAEEKIERDRVFDIIKTQPKQFQAVIYSIFAIKKKGIKNIFTGEIYEYYKELCLKTNLRPLTQRRVSDVIAELDMLGIVNAKVISKGRYGRTREITLTIPKNIEPKIIEMLVEELNV
jgi:archaeal cell division control protein 6